MLLIVISLAFSEVLARLRLESCFPEIISQKQRFPQYIIKPSLEERLFNQFKELRQLILGTKSVLKSEIISLRTDIGSLYEKRRVEIQSSDGEVYAKYFDLVERVSRALLVLASITAHST